MSKNKLTILGTLVFLIIASLGTLILINRSGNNMVETELETNSQVFNTVPTAGLSFQANIDGTTLDGQTYNATVLHDAKGNSHLSGDVAEESFDLYSIDGRYIYCSNGDCIENPALSAPGPIGESSYILENEDLEQYRESAVNIGTADCGSNTCQIWERSEDSYTGRLYVDDSGLVKKAEWSGDEGNFVINYEYKEVNITPPENILTSPTA